MDGGLLPTLLIHFITCSTLQKNLQDLRLLIFTLRQQKEGKDESRHTPMLNQKVGNRGRDRLLLIMLKKKGPMLGRAKEN